MQKSESIKELAVAMAKAQGEIGKAHKNSKNPHFRSTYANLESVWDACREQLSSNNLSVIQTVGVIENKPTLTTMLLHSSGEFIQNTVVLPTTKPGPQEIGSCLTYMKRYCLAAIVGVSDSDDDGEAAENRPQEKEQKQPEAPRYAPPTTKTPEVVEKPLIDQISDLARVKNVTNMQLKEFISKMGKKKSAECTEEELMTIFNWLKMK